MPSTYEAWLTDDAGNRLMLLKDYQTLSYARSLLGLSTLTIILPYREFVKQISPYFQPDRRIEVYRSPMEGMPLRREGVWLLREPRVYTRDSDNVQMIQFYGRNAIDLLRRRMVIQAAGTSWTRKTGAIDDLMKEIVREQMLYGSALDENGVVDNTRAYPQNEFTVQADLTLGTSVTMNCPDRYVHDILKELKDASFQLAQQDTANSKIYFDVVPTLTGFEFQTYADLYGIDRTTGIVYSVENGNLKAPYYSNSHLEEVNVVYVKGFGRGDSRAVEIVSDADRVNSSRWNRCEGYRDASNEPDQDNLADVGVQDLWQGMPKEEITAEFLNTPGGPDAPRSLYGVDWDLGDLLPVEYAGKRFDIEVSIIYVSLNEAGEETVTGRNEVNNASD